MNPRPMKVETLDNYCLKITFKNNEVRFFDMNPYLNTGIFIELKDPSIFNTAKVENNTITWINGQDLCPDTFYQESQA